jgi:hypothetical protein
MEELVWANRFELGYQKHPPLPTWLLYPLTIGTWTTNVGNFIFGIALRCNMSMDNLPLILQNCE